MPLRERSMVLASACINQRAMFLTAYSEVKAYLAANPTIKTAAGTIGKRDFTELVTRNHILSTLNKTIYNDILSRLPEIADVIMSEKCSDHGLFNGSMGRAIWLFHYGRFASNPQATDVAIAYFKRSITHLKHCSFDFASGLSGIGWGLIYLYVNGFISLHKFELREIVSLMSESQTNDGTQYFDYGSLAFSCALSSIQSLSDLSEPYTQSLELTARNILENSNDTIEAFYSFLWFLIKSHHCREAIPMPQIADWICPPNFIASDHRFWTLSLRNGIMASSINVMLNHHIISDNESQVQQVCSLS